MRFPLLPLLFIVLPLAEIGGFIIVGSEIGVLATIGLIIGTTILGAILLRIQGFGAMTRIRTAMETGASPGRDLVHGAMIMLAGILLILPGFITDALGLLMFIPAVRNLVWALISRNIVVVNTGSGFRRPQTGRTIDLDDDDFARESSRERPRPALDDDR